MEKNIISRVISKFRPINAVLDTSVLEAGWHTVNSTVNHYADDMYENGYSSIRAIANRYMTLVPYAIDDNGKPLATPPNVIQALSRPNQDMSGVDFRDALAVMTMVHDNVYVLVHEKFGRTTRPAREGIREDQIAGFTFLENAIEVSIDGKIQYEVYKSGSKDVYYPYQVLDLHDVNPKNLSKGYSPSRAARRWTKIDDYIADYQGGFFENGAVPAGQFIITAPSAQEYKDIVRNLKKKHRGAGQNNNVTYTYAPIDPVSGKPGQAAITWVPFNTTNKDLSLQELFNQANKKIDSVYGVSAFIRAIDEAPNFATAQVIERNFVENTVRPFAIKKWGRIQHELNRITGGLGYGISFKLETPHIAEEQKSTAETDLVIWNTIKDIIASGFTYDSAVNTLKLPPNWALLEEGENKTTTINNPKTDVGEGSDVPANKLKKKTKSRQPKAELTDQERIENATTKFMRSQVDNAIEQYSESVKNSIKMQDPTQAEIDAYIAEMMAIITGILTAYGIEGYAEGALIADLTVGELNGYVLTETSKNAYETYLKKVAESYGADTSDSIRKVLSEANLNGLNRVETEKALKNIMDTDDWRVKRLARTELNNSSNVGKLEGMKAMSTEAGGRWEKTINHTKGGICPLCESQEGIWTALDIPLWGVGDSITTVNDKGDTVIYINNWQDNQANDYHPQGRGTLIFRRAE